MELTRDRRESISSEGADSSSSSGGSNVAMDEYLCPICLQEVTGASYVDPCYHKFCFPCICQWIEFRQSCPLCNGKVHAIVEETANGEIIKTPVAQNTRNMAQESRRRGSSSSRVYGRNQAASRADMELGTRKRKAVYIHRLRRANPGVNETSRRTRISQVPELLRQEITSGQCQEWIRRDISVILDTDDVDFFVSLVVSSVKDAGSLKMQDVGETVARFLEDATELFLLELASFVDSPLDMGMYDRYIVYNTAASSSRD